MTCPNCNSNTAEGSIFCENCGTRLDQSQASATPASAEPTPVAPAPKKPLDKRILIGAAALLVVLAVVIVCVVTHKHKIDLNDYITVEFEGYNTMGTANVTFDYEAFEEEVEEYADIDLDDEDIPDSLSDVLDSLEDLSDSAGYLAVCQGMDWELSKESELSNGEEVTLTFSYDNDNAKKYGIKFAADEVTYTVSGLKDVQVVDAFADITVSFSGVSPNASVNIENNSTNEAVKNQYFYAEDSSGIKKGDTVTVKVDPDEEYLLSEYGCKFKELSKEYTCDNVDEYIMDGSEISDDVLASMKSQTKDVVEAYLADNTSEIKGSSIKYEGYYFLGKKEESTSSWDDNNMVYVVYSAKVKSKEKKFKETLVYMPVKFTNVIKYADGTDYVDLNRTGINGTTDLQYGWWNHVSGYTKQSEMKNELITSEKSTYNTASFGGLD